MKTIVYRSLLVLLLTTPLYSQAVVGPFVQTLGNSNKPKYEYVGTTEAEWDKVNKEENDAITSVQNELDELKRKDPSSPRVEELKAKIKSMTKGKRAQGSTVIGDSSTADKTTYFLSSPNTPNASNEEAKLHRKTFKIDENTNEKVIEAAIRAAVMSGNKAALDAILNGGGGGGALPPAPPAPPIPPLPIPPI